MMIHVCKIQDDSIPCSLFYRFNLQVQHSDLPYSWVTVTDPMVYFFHSLNQPGLGNHLRNILLIALENMKDPAN